MKKIMFLVLLLAFMSAMLVGCQSKGNTIVNTDKTNTEQQSIVADTNQNDIEQQLEVNETNILDGEVAYISITNLKGNSETIFDDDDSIETMKSVITSAEREAGIVNMLDPHYKMMVVYENEEKQIFNLYIAKKDGNSALMNTNDTHTIYTISEEMNIKLLELIE